MEQATCEFCKKTLSNKYNLQAHYQRCAANKYECEIQVPINLDPSYEELEFEKIYNFHMKYLGEWNFKFKETIHKTIPMQYKRKLSANNNENEIVQSTKKNAKSKDDSDIDIVELDDNDDNLNKKPSALRAKPAVSARKTQINYGDDNDNDKYLKPSKSKSKTLTTSSSTRRARIEYDDDIEYLDSKKLTKNNIITIDDDDDDKENKSRITRNFGIFKTKTTAKKKL